MAVAEQLLIAANADIGAAKALFFPAIGLTGFLGGMNGDLTSYLGGGGLMGSLTPGLLQPIFNAGRLKQNVAVMQARFDAGIAEYQKAALNGYREVANALVTIQRLAEIREQQRIGGRRDPAGESGGIGPGGVTRGKRTTSVVPSSTAPPRSGRAPRLGADDRTGSA